ncbi:D-alanyl-D-alanine carboxypeptidase [Desulfosporosinus orientis DSM 765]|uniref:serine-type D-Ala-D-Ala carboxypeptidase n=1 Tax=Desulfosporosinus orientis (strain ATCC 19365 / DSM 765 / NCIMB 8382 / VKM B-1628 / Singapore I) TaxID=768706 RepID=G7W974_DESOD|nr:D-alanyl-D-alanine carboxypeptidase family protein [Desulfosporosinus orientis]AET68715.1 D-alanyl-D-alanine carboxypeptidase [Desulfosporosinus orientis DSM 765]
MKFITTVLLALYLLFSVSPPAYADNTAPPDIRGEGGYLIDVQSGQTLFQKNPDELLAPASTTKIMTALLAIENGHFDDTVTISSTMLNSKLVYGTQIYLEPGEKLTVRDLLYATLLNSANDAAVALAEYVGKDVDSFVDLMNQRAQEIGATKTHFVNPSGLTEKEHLTTPHDLALIARVAYQNPTFAQFVRTKTQAISRSKDDVPVLMVNENKLLWRDSTVDGIKTGYTSEAQNCLVASATKDGRQLIGVILKSPGKEIYTDMQAMFDYGFTQYKNNVVKPAGSVLSSITVNNEPVDLTIDSPIYVTQKLNEDQPLLNLRVTSLNTEPLTSVEKGQAVAQVEVLEGEKHLNTLPLIASKTVLPKAEEPKGFFASLSLPWMAGTLLVILGFAAVIDKQRNRARYLRRRARRLRRENSKKL